MTNEFKQFGNATKVITRTAVKRKKQNTGSDMISEVYPFSETPFTSEHAKALSELIARTEQQYF